MNKIREGFLAKNVLMIDGHIDPDMVSYMREALEKLYLAGSPDITLLISSHGGDAIPALDIFDMLSLYPGKKTGLVTVCARSMAAVLVQACDKRLATQHADILIHHVLRNLSLDVLKDSKKISKARHEMEKTQNRIYDILVKRTGKTVTDISKECEKEHHMTVEEAIAFGLIDAVNTEPLPK